MSTFAKLSAILLLLGALSPRISAAEGISLKKGLWNFETTSVMSMMPQPKVIQSTECIDQDSFDPVKEMTAGGNCKILERSQSGNSLKWKMECANGMGGPPMTGSGEMTATDESVSGSMVSTMVLPGAKSGPIKLDVKWKGNYVGACKP